MLFPQIGYTLDLVSLGTGFSKHRQEHCGKNGDNRNDNNKYLSNIPLLKKLISLSYTQFKCYFPYAEKF